MSLLLEELCRRPRIKWTNWIFTIFWFIIQLFILNYLVISHIFLFFFWIYRSTTNWWSVTDDHSKSKHFLNFLIMISSLRFLKCANMNKWMCLVVINACHFHIVFVDIKRVIFCVASLHQHPFLFHPLEKEQIWKTKGFQAIIERIDYFKSNRP